MARSSWRGVAVGGATWLLAGSAGCSAGSASPDPPRLVTPDRGSGGAAKLPETRGGIPYTFGSLTLCLTRPKRAMIEAVTVAKSAGGLAVRAFAVRPNPMERGGGGGAEQTTLRAAGFNPAARTVDAVCVNGASPDASVAAEGGVHSVELAVELVKPSDATASGQALDITYSIQGEHHTMRWPFGVTLCRPVLKDYVTQCP